MPDATQEENNVMPQRTHMLSIQVQPDITAIRVLEHLGVEHTIIPCVALVEGVLWPSHADHAELALAEEFGRFPDSWNGRPVVMNHPAVNGVPVSASSPVILEEFAFGSVFNTELRENKLHMELWINNERVTELGGEIEETVKRLVSGTKVVEISTGLFVMNEEKIGVFEGEGYGSIWRNIVPDHLAILSEGSLGACSVEDGCGAPRTNEMKPAMQAVLLEHTPPGVPIIGEHAHECECGGTCDKCVTLNTAEHKTLFKALSAKLQDITNTFMEAVIANKKHKAISDHDLRMALAIALDTTVDDITFITAIFQQSEGAGFVVYEEGFNNSFKQRNFSITDKGAVTLGSKVISVRPMTEFVPVEVSVNVGTDKSLSAQENSMNKEERVAALIANTATKFTDDDKDFLMGLEEAQLERMEPVVAAAHIPGEDDEDEDDTTRQNATDLPNGDGNTDDHSVMSLQEHLQSMPVEMRGLIQAGLDDQAAKKNALVKSLRANESNAFSQVELEAFDIPQLEKLAALGHVTPDYSGQGLGGEPRANAGSENFTPAPNVLLAKVVQH